MGMVQQPQ